MPFSTSLLKKYSNTARLNQIKNKLFSICKKTMKSYLNIWKGEFFCIENFITISLLNVIVAQILVILTLFLKCRITKFLDNYSDIKRLKKGVSSRRLKTFSLLLLMEIKYINNLFWGILVQITLKFQI
jgi:hypothetical protein